MVIKPKDAKGSRKITSYFNKRSQPMSEPVSKRPKLTDRDAAPTPSTSAEFIESEKKPSIVAKDVSMELAQENFKWINDRVPINLNSTSRMILFDTYVSVFDESLNLPTHVFYKLVPRDYVKAPGVEKSSFRCAVSRSVIQKDFQSCYKSDPDYHRSHLLPAAARSNSVEAYQNTFTYENCVPLLKSFNQILCTRIENAESAFVDAYGCSFVITGVIFGENSKTIGVGKLKLKIPKYYYKILIADGFENVVSSTSSRQTLKIQCFLSQNEPVTSSLPYMTTFLTDLNNIRKLAGFDVLSGISTNYDFEDVRINPAILRQLNAGGHSRFFTTGTGKGDDSSNTHDSCYVCGRKLSEKNSCALYQDPTCTTKCDECVCQNHHDYLISKYGTNGVTKANADLIFPEMIDGVRVYRCYICNAFLNQFVAKDMLESAENKVICLEKLCLDHHKHLTDSRSDYTGPYRDQADQLQKVVKNYQTHDGETIPCNGVPNAVVQQMRNGERVTSVDIRCYVCNKQALTDSRDMLESKANPVICDEKLCSDHHKHLTASKSIYTGPYRDQAEKLQKTVLFYHTHDGDKIPCNGVPDAVVQQMRNGERIE